jgi:hypothetical protein
VATEARCKVGLCLVGLNRPAEAVRAFEEVMNQPGEQWPLVAATQLWLAHLREKRYAEADAVYAAVSVRYSRDQLAQYVPASVREELGGTERGALKVLNPLLPDPKLIARLEAIIRLADLLQLPDAPSYSSSLVVALALNRQYARAAALAERNLTAEMSYIDPAGTHPNESCFWTLRWYCWSRRAAGEGQAAADQTDAWTRNGLGRLAPNGTVGPGARRTFVPFRLEQARCLTAAGKWAEAEAAVDAFLHDFPTPITNYVFYAQPHLLKGFLRARDGDEAGA